MSLPQYHIFAIYSLVVFETSVHIILQFSHGYAGYDTPMMVVGNKCDLGEKRKVTRDMVEWRAERYGATLFFEVSAKTGENINEVCSC